MLTREVLQYTAVQLLYEEDSVFIPQEIDPISERSIISHITCKWIDSFLSRFDIFLRKQSGSLSRPPPHTIIAEKFIPYHLGCLPKRFLANVCDKNLVEIWKKPIF